ncbi:MAG: imidazoleglycerol-phosphate dehydratase HisB [Chloroflexi bacterium]|nr:imidazoleglycerol-phosphate dehydratase HisB [Chloroflexota bacterium]
MIDRVATVKRETQEVKIEITLNLDGKGVNTISTGIGMFDHMLSQVSKHGLFDLYIKASGDLNVSAHHTVEDVAIVLGKTFDKALGDKKGLIRMAHAFVPMDESLAMVAIDISGRGYAQVDASFFSIKIGEMSTDLIRHFFESFAIESKINIHALILAGKNDHHKAEALFKALGRALCNATRIEPRIMNEFPSTKGII